MEALVAIGLAMLMMTGVIRFFAFQLGAMRVEQARMAAQLAARGTLDFITRQLEHVGRDPQAVLFAHLDDASLPPAIVEAGTSLLHYRTNLSADTDDNDTDDTWEDVTFDEASGVIRVAQGADDPVPVTDGTARRSHVPPGGLRFGFFDATGAAVTNLDTAANRRRIRRITVTVTVVGGPAGGDGSAPVTLSRDVFLRNVS